MKHVASEALAFLRLLYAEGPWHLVAIDPETRETFGHTFRPADEAGLAAWLDAHAARNIYYHVNTAVEDPGPATRGKATKASVARVAYFHVDVDPDAKKDLVAEQFRIERALADPTAFGLPAPTAVVWSGGGCNGLWKLADAVTIEGESEAAREASADAVARYNLQIERLLGGDHCHNVDRILRVPGTVNWPDEGKRKKGRAPAMARLISWNAARVYPVDRFVAAPVVQNGGSPGSGARKVNVSGNVARLRSLDELPDAVTKRTRELILHGEFPGEPGRFESASHASHHAACELVRAGCTDDQIFAVLTDPAFAISRHVLKKKSGAERYAIRQIGRARDACVDPKLDEMNERHAVIGNLGGKCRVVEEVEDPVLRRKHLTKQSFEDVRNRYMHVKVAVGEDSDGEAIIKNLGSWWLDHARRRQFDRVVFAPGREVPDSYNLWQGFAYEALPGKKHESFLEHVRANVCGGDEVNYNYLVAWMARCVQQPDRPGEVAIVLRGKEGVGKGRFATHFGALWGKHYLPVTDAKHLTGSFNAHLRDCVVLFADEAFHANDKQGAEKLKTLITERTNTIEAKGIDMEIAPNFAHVIMASNNRWVVPAGPHSRRYHVLDVVDERMLDKPYFRAIERDLEDGGYENLLHYLMQLRIDDWDPLPVPRTAALVEQRIYSLSSEEEWWFRKLTDGVLMPQAAWEAPFAKQDLFDDYYDYMKALGWGKRATATALTQFLVRALPDGWPRVVRVTRSRVGMDRMLATDILPGLQVPAIDLCRQWWDKHFGTSGGWQSDDEIENFAEAGIASDDGDSF